MKAPVVVAMFLVQCVGCVATPLPDPPMLRADRLGIHRESPDAVRLVADPGAVSIPGSLVSTLNLDDSEPPAVVRADEEGGFLALVSGTTYDVFRLQAENDGQRSRPLDVVVMFPEVETMGQCFDSPSAELCPYLPDQESCDGRDYCRWETGTCLGQEPETTPLCDSTDEQLCLEAGCAWENSMAFVATVPDLLGDCLVLDPAAELSITSGGTGVVTITNGCDEDFSLDYSLRVGGLGFEIADETPEARALPPGDSTVVIVAFSSGAAPSQDVLIIGATSPSALTQRFYVTLRGN